MAAGQQYFVKLTDMGNGIGNYSFVLGDDFGNTPGTAQSVPLNGQERQVGSIDTPSDVDILRLYRLHHGAAPGPVGDTLRESLSGLVHVMNGADEALLAASGSQGSSFLVVSVTAGETYFIETSGGGQSIGKYDLVLETSGLLVAGPASPPPPGEGGFPHRHRPRRRGRVQAIGVGLVRRFGHDRGGRHATGPPAAGDGLAPPLASAGTEQQPRIGEFVPVSVGGSVAPVANLFLVNGEVTDDNPPPVPPGPDVPLPESSRLLRFYLAWKRRAGGPHGTRGPRPGGGAGPRDGSRGGTVAARAERRPAVARGLRAVCRGGCPRIVRCSVRQPAWRRPGVGRTATLEPCWQSASALESANRLSLKGERRCLGGTRTTAVGTRRLGRWDEAPGCGRDGPGGPVRPGRRRWLAAAAKWG